MDGLHDVNATFSLCDKLNIQLGIKIRKNASSKGIGARPREVRLFQELGYADWAKSSNMAFVGLHLKGSSEQ